jgi:hypothetical protein
MRVVETMLLLVLLVCGRVGMLSILRAIAPDSLTSIMSPGKQRGLIRKLHKWLGKSEMIIQGDAAVSRHQYRIGGCIMFKTGANL